MRYIQAGFVGEGPTDAQFLAPMTRRLLAQHLIAHARSDVEVPEPDIIKPRGSWGNEPRAVLDELEGEYSYLSVLFYHTDAAGSVQAAYGDRVDQVSSRSAIPVVGVVPRREMEAWALDDSSALCRALGVDAARFAVPAQFSANRVEGITDPKSALEEFADSVPGRHFVSTDPELTLFGALAREVDLDVIRAVPQVGRLDRDIADVATTQNWLV